MTPEEFWSILHCAPEPVPVFYRAYYNPDGTIVCYTMEDLPGNYIDIDVETYQRSNPHAKVINGRVVETKTNNKLKPTGNGTACAPDDVCIVVDESKSYVKWSLN